VLYRVLFHYFEQFLAEYESRFEREYGFLRPIIKEVVERYLDCGNPRCGFARIRCPSCGEERFVMFSCRTRGFCPIVPCQADRRVGRVDEGGTYAGCPPPPGCLHRAQDAAVFALLLSEELISEAMVEKIAGWRHSGFSVHSKVRAPTREEAERVGKYMIRPLLSLERLSFSEKDGKVSYRCGKQDEERMDYLEFIARVTSHIPDKGQVMVRYFGLYANAHRGKVRKSEKEAHKLVIIEQECPRIPRRGWAEMISKVYEVDPLICPRCNGQMRVIAFITNYPVVDRILNHLKLTFVADKPPPPRIAYQEVLMTVETSAEYFS